MTTTAATRRRRGLRGSEDGATAVEAALVLSIVVGVVLTIIDFAQAFFIWNTLQLVVGQASRYVMVQTSILDPPPGSASANCQPPAGSATSCAVSALTTLLPGASSSCVDAPTPGQYCVGATCTANSCSLSAQYGFKFVGTYTLAGQITVPISLPPD
jgi:Flp pilus assembly protein TadG